MPVRIPQGAGSEAGAETIMGALIPLLAQLVPGLITGVETLFAGKPKSGPHKLEAVIDALRQIIERMMSAGAPLPDGTQIPEKSVSDDLLRGMIETELTRLRSTGKLSGKTVTGDLFLVRGTIAPVNL